MIQDEGTEVLGCAALQLRAGPWAGPEEWRRHCAALVEEAAERGARVVAMPALTGLLWGPGFLEDAASLASSHRVYLAAGTVAEPRDGGWAHVAPVFGPSGELLGSQAQLHLTPRDRGAGWVPGAGASVFRAGPATLGILVQADVWFPEVARALCLLGADLLLALCAVPAPYSPWLQVAGSWQEAQQNQVFLTEACLVGEAAQGMPGGSAPPGALPGVPPGPPVAAAARAGTGLPAFPEGRLEGRSAIVGPCEITPGETGFLAQARDPGAPEAVVCALDFAALDGIWLRYPIFNQLNHRLYEGRLPAAYARVGGEPSGFPA
ncbi:MAG: hypothetical protein K6T75_05590 [Acetobacteraceae bacterium]|nr:hypothetical protein [Acetobacteraceae bacterium]